MPATQHLPQGLSATLLKLVLQSFKSQSSLLLQDGGVVVSPVSILYAVALILNAAAPCSPTHSQLWSLLRACHPGGEEQLNHLLNHLLKLLTAPGKLPHAGAAQQASSVSRHPDAPPHLGGPPSEQYAPAVQPSEEVDIAVGVFLHETRLLPTFAARMLSTLNATAREVCSYLEVNAWLQQRTRGAVARGLRGYFPGAVLLSSLHFKAKWEQPFDARFTRPGPFSSPIGFRVVDMMNSVLHGAAHLHVPGVLDAVHLPYKGRQYSAVLVLPALPTMGLDDTLWSFYSNPKPFALWSSSPLDLCLPRFSVGTEVQLQRLLGEQGVNHVFDQAKADMARMSPNATYLSHAQHQVRVEVEEEGTNTSAVTTLTPSPPYILPPGPIISMEFNRPFLFIIQHNTTQLPLLICKVIAPAGSTALLLPPQQQQQRQVPLTYGPQPGFVPVGFGYSGQAALGDQTAWIPVSNDPAPPTTLHSNTCAPPQYEQINAAGCPVRLGCASGQHDGSRTFYCGRWLGPAALPGSDGRCGPHDGPACRDCAAFLPRNADGQVARFGAGGCSHLLYCGQYVGVQQDRGPQGQVLQQRACYCGPVGGPQCRACRLLQMQVSGGYLRNCHGVPVYVGEQNPWTGARRFYCSRTVTAPGNQGTQVSVCGPQYFGPKCVACRMYVPRNVLGDEVRLGVNRATGEWVLFCEQQVAGREAVRCSLQPGSQCRACRKFQVDCDV